MVTLFRLLILIIINILSTCIWGQEYNVEVTQYGVKEGLSHRTVLDIHQDQRGFIWLATNYGLNRFDGKDFQWFTKEKQGLPSNYIKYIKEDKKGMLWVFMNDDEKAWSAFVSPEYLIVLNPETLEIVPIEEYIEQDLPFSLNQVIGVDQTKEGGFVFMTNQYSFYSYRNQTFKKISNPFQEVYDFYISEENTIVGLTRPGYRMVELSLSGKVLKNKAFPKGYYTDDRKGTIRPIEGTKYDNNYLFAGLSQNGQNVLFQATSSPNLEPLPLPTHVPTIEHAFRLFYNQAKDWYWYSNARGATVFNFDGIIQDFSEYPELSKSIVNDILFTKDIIWVGTTNGLYKVRITENPFASYLKAEERKNMINETYTTRGILPINNQLFVNVGNAKGRYLIDLKTNEVKRILNKNGQLLFYPKVIFKENEEWIWFAGYSIIRYNLKTGEDVIYTEDKNVFTWSMYQDVAGEIWLGRERGLGYIDKKNQKALSYPIKNTFKAINEQVIYAFLELSKTEVLLSTSGGVYVFNPEEGRITNKYWGGGKGEQYFPHNTVHHIHQDKAGVFWVATAGGGLIRWERKGNENSFEQFTKADGLSNNTIYAVYEDKRQNLWLSSDYGLMVFNKTTKFCRAYLEKDGINQQEFNRIAHYQAEDGRLYFGGLNGITAFYPEEVLDVMTTSNVPLEIVSLSQFSSNAEKIVDKTAAVIQTSTVTLHPGDRFFDLSFALLNFEITTLNNYAYKVEGVDNSWNYISDNYIRVSGLPYGKHTLRVRGQNPNGQFSTQEINLTIHVIRPIYLRWWFVVLIVVAVGVSVSLWYQWRTRQLKTNQIRLEKEVAQRTEKIQQDKQVIEQQAEELKQLDQLKSRFFANISHELRTPLTLMLAPIDAALKRNRLEKQEFTFLQTAKQNGRQLLKLINSILDLTKLDANKLELHKAPVALYPFVRRVVATFEAYAQNQGIHLTFSYQGEETLRIQTDKEKMEIIFNNLLSNAIKYTSPGGEVAVKVKETANDIQIIVSDTGRGIHADDLPFVFDRYYQTKQANAAAEGGTGIGLALVKELVGLLEGNIELESEIGQGSTFMVTFPRVEIFDTTPITEEENIAEILDFDFESEEVTSTDAAGVRHILIVEDNPTLRNFIKSLLSFHQITTAENGQEALLKLGMTSEELGINTDIPNSSFLIPDLIISDVMMPIMDGFQLLDRLKSNENYRHIPILMLTARASMGDKLKALRIGVDDYMTKPFEQDELFARVNNLLKNTANRTKWIEEIAPELEAEEILEQQKEAEEMTLMISDTDKAWLESLEAAVQKYVADDRLSTNFLAEAMLLSRSQLFRRLKKLTGLSPSEYIKEYRLKKAYELLENKTYDSVKAVSLSVGITHRTTFNTQFKERFGKLPSEYL